MQVDKRRDGETRARQNNTETGLYCGTGAAAAAADDDDDDVINDEDQIKQDEIGGLCGT